MSWPCRTTGIALNGHPLAYLRAREDYGAGIARKLQRFAFFAEEDLASVVHPVMGLRSLGAARRTFGPVVVPAGKYFLMGDSRDNSLDSREFGFAARDAILGRAGGILVSLDINDSYLPRTSRFFTDAALNERPSDQSAQPGTSGCDDQQK